MRRPPDLRITHELDEYVQKIDHSRTAQLPLSGKARRVLARHSFGSAAAATWNAALAALGEPIGEPCLDEPNVLNVLAADCRLLVNTNEPTVSALCGCIGALAGGCDDPAIGFLWGEALGPYGPCLLNARGLLTAFRCARLTLDASGRRLAIEDVSASERLIRWPSVDLGPVNPVGLRALAQCGGLEELYRRAAELPIEGADGLWRLRLGR